MVDELELVKQVELRLVLISNEEKLTNALDLYLCPLLLKLGSDRSDVREKTIKVLEHVNLRLGPTVQLPTLKLLAQLRDSSLSSLVKQVNLTFLKKALKVSSVDSKELAIGLRSQPAAVAKVQFALFLQVFDPSLELDDLDSSYIVSRFTELFLVDLRYKERGYSPGLSSSAYDFISYELTESKLSELKPKILAWSERQLQNNPDSGVAQKLAIMLIVASKDRLSDVSSLARGLLKKYPIKLQSYEELVKLCSGTATTQPVKSELQAKIFDVLSQTDLVGVDPYPLVKPALQGDQHLAPSALGLIRAAMRKNALKNPEPLLADVQNAITISGWPKMHPGGNSKLRELSYETVGMLASACPPNIAVVNFLLQSLERDDVEYTASIQSALSDLINTKWTNDSREELIKLLFKVYLASDRMGTRYTCVRYANRAFDFSDARARFLALFAQSPENRSDVIDEGKRGTNPDLFKMDRQVDLVEYPSADALTLLLGENVSHLPNLPVFLSFILKCIYAHAGIPDVSLRHSTKPLIQEALSHHEETLCILSKLCVVALGGTDPPYKVWSVLSLSPPKVLEYQQQFVPQLRSINDKLLNDSVSKSIAALYPGDPSSLAQSLTPTPANALLYSYLVRFRDATLEEPWVEYCLSQKCWDALFQLSLSGRLNVTESLRETVKKSQTEKSLLAYGGLSLNDASEVYLHDLLETTSSSKNLDFLLASGESLSIATSGWNSTVLDSPREDSRNRMLEALKVLFKRAKGSPIQRRSACVQLLCLVQYSRSQLDPYLSDVQACLMTFLADADEISQESASRALGLLFEFSDKATQKKLVKDLVQMFTNEHASKAMAGKISEDTQLFEPGVLNTGEGSVSTYKDVLNLASEVGDTSLVYKFMSLASSSKLWGTKRGAAFGLESIISSAGVDDELVSADSAIGKNLVPKLYRYQFDSNPQVKNTMKSIWASLVKDSQKTIQAHFSSIIDELLKGTTNYEWRTRQASTLALTDLVETQDWSSFKPWTEQLWNISFRMVDDIKDSVREAGFRLTKALVQVVTRRLDAQARGNSELLEILLPFLFSSKGIHNDSKEVRTFALSALLKIASSGSKDVEPFLFDIVEQFTLLLSTLEPEAMNYIALNSGNFGVNADLVDETRAQQIRHSPIMETIEKIIDKFNNEQLKVLLTRSPALVKKAVGLPSKVGLSKVIVSACMRFPTGVNVDPLINACLSQIHDRNAIVSQSFAVALGYLSRLAQLEQVKQYVKTLLGLYFDPGADETARLAVANCLKALSSHASDKFLSLASLTLSFAFVAKFDLNEKVAKVFAEVWDSNTGGTASIKVYAPEIVEISVPHLASSSWNLRQSCAKAIGQVCDYIPYNSQLLESLLTALQGRTWNGKEYVYAALSYVSRGGLKDEELKKATDRSINEVQRRNGEYVIEILPSVGDFLDKNSSEDLYKVFYPRVLQSLDGEVEGEKVSDDSKIKIFHGAIKAYHTGYNLEDTMEKVLMKMTVGWKFKQALCEALIELGEKQFFSHDIWLQACKLCGHDYGHEVVRLAWAKAAVALRDFGIAKEVRETVKNETSTVVLTELSRAGFFDNN